MGYLNNIEFKNFRNFSHFNLDFSNNCNIFYGINGSGKTNILEGISLFTKGTGIRNEKINNLIKSNKLNFSIFGNLESNSNNYELKTTLKNNNGKYKKILSVNGDSSLHSIKNINSILSFLYFLPEMERLFLLTPSYRRNFIDKFIFSYIKNYNKTVNIYKKNILERSSILKLNNYDLDWIENIERNIAEYGINIYNLRNDQINILSKNLKILNSKNEYSFEVDIFLDDNFYEKKLDIDKYASELKKNREFDKKFGGTKYGPHRSDFIFKVNNKFFADQLSTGQQKTLVLLLLLSQSNYLISEKKIKPILLLDEVCSHLDDQNRKILLDLCRIFNIQVFMTGTDETLFSFISTNSNFYNISI